MLLTENYYNYVELLKKENDLMYENLGFFADPIEVNHHVRTGWELNGYDYRESQDEDGFYYWDADEMEEDDWDALPMSPFYDEDYDEDEVEDEDEESFEPLAGPVESNKIVDLDQYRQRKTRRDFYLSLVKNRVRCRTVSDILKRHYHDICQVCSNRIDLGQGEFYSETHHIRPRSEDGPDIFSNMIVVCGNCHVMFDKGAIMIDLSRRLVVHANPLHELNGKGLTLRHTINSQFVTYHNEKYSCKY